MASKKLLMWYTHNIPATNNIYDNATGNVLDLSGGYLVTYTGYMQIYSTNTNYKIQILEVNGGESYYVQTKLNANSIIGLFEYQDYSLSANFSFNKLIKTYHATSNNGANGLPLSLNVSEKITIPTDNEKYLLVVCHYEDGTVTPHLTKKTGETYLKMSDMKRIFDYIKEKQQAGDIEVTTIRKMAKQYSNI